MKIALVSAMPDHVLKITTDDGTVGYFDVTPYLGFDAFKALVDPKLFSEVSSGGYYIEWSCGADLSADTIEAQLQIPTPVAH